MSILSCEHHDDDADDDAAFGHIYTCIASGMLEKLAHSLDPHDYKVAPCYRFRFVSKLWLQSYTDCHVCSG